MVVKNDMTRKHPILENLQFVSFYLDQLLNPRRWVEIANEMIEATNILEPQLRKFWIVATKNVQLEKLGKSDEHSINPPPNLHGPYFILTSYAIENLLKALIIRDRRDEIRSQFFQTGSLPRLINGHNLLRLSREAKIKMDVYEEDVLTRLSRQSKWKGRYPVPVELAEMRNIAKYSDGKSYFMDYYKLEDINLLNKIVKKLSDEIASSTSGQRS